MLSGLAARMTIRTEIMLSNYQPHDPDRPTPRGVPAALSNEIQAAAAHVAEQVLTKLLGRTYSPRLKLLDIKQVSEATGLGRSTIFALVREGKFPKPQRELGRNLWRESTLIRWMDANDPNGGD